MFERIQILQEKSNHKHKISLAQFNNYIPVQIQGLCDYYFGQWELSSDRGRD